MVYLDVTGRTFAVAPGVGDDIVGLCFASMSTFEVFHYWGVGPRDTGTDDVLWAESAQLVPHSNCCRTQRQPRRISLLQPA